MMKHAVLVGGHDDTFSHFRNMQIRFSVLQLGDSIGENLRDLTSDIHSVEDFKVDTVIDAIGAIVAERPVDYIFSFSDMARSLLMHIVLEASGEIWHREAARVFVDIPHYREHGEDDGDHVQMGIQLLSSASPDELADLRATLAEGWKMITLLCDRMAAVATSEKLRGANLTAAR